MSFKNIQELEKRLWNAADELRANSGLTASQYSQPVLGLIFLRYAEHRFVLAKEKIEAKQRSRRRGGDIKTAIQAEGAMYIPEKALFSKLLELPEGADVGRAVNDAMKALEAENEALKDTLPKTYTKFDDNILIGLLKNFAGIKFDIGSDVFGRIYEYFLTEFAKSEGQGWSLNPGRYVGVAEGEEEDDEDFRIRLEELQEELEVLNAEAHELEKTIAVNVAGILG